MSDQEAGSDKVLRSKRSRRMTDKGLMYVQSIQADNEPTPEKTQKLSTSLEAITESGAEPGDSFNPQVVIDTEPGTDEEVEPVDDDTDHRNGAEQTQSDVTLPKMAMMARWFSEMTQIMGEMRQMKQDFVTQFAEFRAITESPPTASHSTG